MDDKRCHPLKPTAKILLPSLVAVIAVLGATTMGYKAFSENSVEAAHAATSPAQDGAINTSADAMSATPLCADIAPHEKAEALIKRLFPKSTIHFAEPLRVSPSTCLLEVEMSVEADNPATRGFVYVLPDGERFLNGPLMDKRSKVETSASAQAALQDAFKEQQQRLGLTAQPQGSESAQQLAAQPSLNGGGDARTAEPRKDGSFLRRQLLERLAQLPMLEDGKADGRPVYVLLDPQCVACQRLFSEREQLAQAHNIHWQWIPMSTNEEGWIKTASILKTATTSPEQAMAMLEEMMQRKWKAQEHMELIKGLTEEDYAAARKAIEVFADIARSSSGSARTPLVAFERPNKSVEVFAGIPVETDWLALSIDPPSAASR